MTTTIPDDARHLTFATLDQLWRNGAPMAVSVQGSPFCRLDLDPTFDRITLVTAYETPEPDVARLQRLTLAASAYGQEKMAELQVQVTGNLHEAYSLLANIADGLQLEERSLAVAVATAVDQHRDLIANRGSMTAEKEIGLYGELLFMEYLVNHIGAGRAVESWQGPLSEEHDFTFDQVHVEVKTTSGERRSHVIHGINQLLPLRGVPLSLLSLQLTRAAPGPGRTLFQLVHDLRAMCGGDQIAFDARLAGAGWDDADADLYRTVWALRSTPRSFAVEESFPAMTSALVAPILPRFELMSDFSYKIDLTALQPTPLPGPLEGFVATKENPQT